MPAEVVDLKSRRRQAQCLSERLDVADIRRAGSGAARLARAQKLRTLCDDVVEALIATEHPISADPAVLRELLEVLDALRSEARFQREHPLRT